MYNLQNKFIEVCKYYIVLREVRRYQRGNQNMKLVERQTMAKDKSTKAQTID